MFYVLLIFGAATIICNIVTFALYATDKRRAANKQWRISEFTLIMAGFIMGGLGALLGMRILRHKTQHIQFKILVPLALVLNLVIIVLVLHFTGYAPWV